MGGGGGGRTLSTIDNGMRAKIPANSELEGTIMQTAPRGTSIQPELILTADNGANGASSYQMKICDLAYHQHSLTSPICPTRLSLTSPESNSWGSAWRRTSNTLTATSEVKKTNLYKEASAKKSAANKTQPCLYGQPNHTTLSWELGSKKNFHTLNCPAPSTNGF